MLHSFAIFPECAAALGADRRAPAAGCLHRRRARSPTPCSAGSRSARCRGSARSTRRCRWSRSRSCGWADRERRAAIVAPYAASVALWFGFFWWIYGTPSPTAPYGPAHQMALANLTSGLPGLFADQEYGLLASAPVLALSVVGWWRLWRRDAAGRWATLTTLVPFGILALTTGAFELWWGGTAPPGRELVAAVPLLAVPLAWAWQSSEDARVQRASLRMARRGGPRDDVHARVRARRPARRQHAGWGFRAARVLDPARALVRAAPSFVERASLTAPALLTLLWAAVAAAGLARRARVRRVDARALRSSRLRPWAQPPC